MFSLLMTRILSGHFSLQDYGTYSQIMLLITTISSLTIMGMMDGINFFFCREEDETKRNKYVSSIFFLQIFFNFVASLAVLLCTVPISRYFNNADIKSLIIFAAALPVLQNTISLLQIMFIAIGKAKAIAVKNLIVSVAKLCVIALACYVFDNIAYVLAFQVAIEISQAVYFVMSLRKSGCKINIFKFDRSLFKEILIYCIPMAMFAVVKSLNRDAGKFVISYFTDTETLAVYTNASKLLPFDIIMTSFCTVLLPYITRYLARKQYENTQNLYKAFLELSYITTTILAIGAVCVAPELMEFLYTAKYLENDFGVTVFIIYILVDVISVLNITLILSAAGKTKTIFLSSVGTLVANVILNIVMFYSLREIGPAVATLLVTLLQGVIIFSLSAKEIKSGFLRMFDKKYLLLFVAELLAMSAVAIFVRRILLEYNVKYFVVLICVYALFVIPLIVVNLKRIFKDLKIINSCKMS